MTRSPTSGLWLVALLSLCRGGGAAADSLEVRLEGALSFTDAQLRAALAQRAALAGAGRGDRLVARVAGDGRGVEVTVVDRTRRVDLEDEEGVGAARLVAFAILDLAGDQLDPPGLEAPERESRATVTLWVTGGAHRTLSLEAGARVARRVRVIGSAGVSMAETHGRAPSAVDLRVFPLRAGVALRAGPIEARVTGVALIEHASNLRSETGGVLGAGAAVAWVRPLGRGVAATVGGGADATITSRDYLVDGRAVVSGERVRWWLGAGASVEVGR